jgi:two-component system response regulator AtoC
MITVSPQMRDFFDLLKRVGRSNSSILIRGETGTGKELVARALHKLSDRNEGPFRALNCATLTSELLASELFGHVRGAFTGAVRDRRGLFSLADRGTIFLDEIAEIPVDIQARLLRVLEERTFTPLGSAESISVDVRLLSATHRALRELVSVGEFREDLMYRIRVVPLFLPRLADREGDVEALAWHFIDQFNDRAPRTIEGIDSTAMDALVSYEWPGNIRELRNVVEYAFAVGVGDILTIDELTPELRGEEPDTDSYSSQLSTLEAMERRQVLEALEMANGKRSEAADILDISRSTLWRRMKELGIS